MLKFDFSEIEGDPLGDLYQRYFDPETRKALGEFYTPQEVVEYIMDGVGYDIGVSSKRLIDPACGSGTFLVEALQRYKKDIRRYNQDPDWENHLTQLCSRPHIVGLDIHPFAVLMAQIRFMVEILPEYREAKRNSPQFTIRRLPIFRTDTLRNERRMSGTEVAETAQQQLTFDGLTESPENVLIPVPLPIEVDDQSAGEDEFLVQQVRMPRFDVLRRKTEVGDYGEYFAALQGVLDVVKYHMNEDIWEYQGGLKEGINRYSTREYEDVEEFFEPYVNGILNTVEHLRRDHGDGRLFKMLEDSVLALVVKNFMKYEYVVGNPPYVNIKNINDEKQQWYKELYQSAYGRFDLYVLFLERGLDMLSEDGKLGYITSNKFAKSRYGKEIRNIISTEYNLEQYIDFGDTGVFEDAVNYPCILIVSREMDQPVHYAKLRKKIDNPLDEIGPRLGKEEFVSDELEVSFYPQSEIGAENWRFTPEKVRELGSKLHENAHRTVGEISLGVREGVAPGGDDAFIVSPEFADREGLEEELLRPLIRGSNVRRWRVAWDNELIIYPYDSDGNLVEIDEYPNIKSHLDDYEEYLKDRYCVKKGGKGIYEYHGPHAKSVYEGDFKIATPDMATENQFSYVDGYDCFKNTVYVVTFDEDGLAHSNVELLGIMNSSIAEFVVKQNSPYVNSKYFRYKTQYVDPIPMPEEADGIEEIVREILRLEGLEQEIRDFPHPYLDRIDGPVERLQYEWKTDRNPVEAEIEELGDGRIAVTAGRTDEITSPILDSGTSEQRQLRARYVLNSVNGRTVQAGETHDIPIPKKQADLEEVHAQFEREKREYQNSSISDLESEIDDLMYEKFDLSEKEQEVIEEYIGVFK